MRRLRTPRGHILVEVLVAGTLLVWALSGIVASLSQGSAQLGLSLQEEQAYALARQKVEQLTESSSVSWAALAGTTVTENDVGGNIGWTRTTAYSGLQTSPVSSPVAAPAAYYEALVTVTTAGGRSATLQAWKWRAF